MGYTNVMIKQFLLTHSLLKVIKDLSPKYIYFGEDHTILFDEKCDITERHDLFHIIETGLTNDPCVVKWDNSLLNISGDLSLRNNSKSLGIKHSKIKGKRLTKVFDVDPPTIPSASRDHIRLGKSFSLNSSLFLHKEMNDINYNREEQIIQIVCQDNTLMLHSVHNGNVVRQTTEAIKGNDQELYISKLNFPSGRYNTMSIHEDIIQFTNDQYSTYCGRLKDVVFWDKDVNFIKPLTEGDKHKIQIKNSNSLNTMISLSRSSGKPLSLEIKQDSMSRIILYITLSINDGSVQMENISLIEGLFPTEIAFKIDSKNVSLLQLPTKTDNENDGVYYKDYFNDDILIVVVGDVEYSVRMMANRGNRIHNGE